MKSGSGPVIAPSILAADFAYLAEEAARVRNADWLHVDVMDGHFVPDITVGLPVVRNLVKASSLPLDCHLMVDDPGRLAPLFAEAGASNVTFHAEATQNVQSLAESVRAAGSTVGLAIDRDTAVEPYLEAFEFIDLVLIMTIKAGAGGQRFLPELLRKVQVARTHATINGLDLKIQVDGGIALNTIAAAATAGADAFVAGTAVYGVDDAASAVDQLRMTAQRAIASRDIP